MKRDIQFLAVTVLLLVASTISAQLSTPSVESVYGGRINAITGIRLSADTSRIFVTTESANTMFYMDVYANSVTPVFGKFNAMPGVDASANYGLNVRTIAAHELSGNVYFVHDTGLLYSNPSSSTVNTVMSGYVRNILIKDNTLIFTLADKLYFGTLDASGSFTAGAGSPLTLPSTTGGISNLYVNPLTDTLYMFTYGSPGALVRFTDKFNNLSSATTTNNISLASLTSTGYYSSMGIAPDGRIFLAGLAGDYKTFAYTDDEINWLAYPSFGGTSGQNLAFAGDSSSYYIYYASLFNSSNGTGAGWYGFGDMGGFETHANDGWVFTDPVNDAIVYMTTDQGIGASIDNGETIFEVDDGIKAVWTRDFDMTASEYTGWLASKSGIRKVTDFKGTPMWTNAIFPRGDGSPYYSAEIDPADSTTVYVGNVRVYKTTDDGNTWYNSFTPEIAPYYLPSVGTKCLAIEVCNYDNNIVMAGYEVQDSLKGGLFYTYDGGNSWTQILLEASVPGEDVDVTDIIFNLEGTDTVAYVSAYYDLNYPQGRSVYKLVKNGNNWVASQDFDGSTTAVGYPITATIWDLDISPAGDTVYAAGTDAGTNHPIAYYKPLDSTALWTTITTSGFPHQPGKEATSITIGVDTVYAAVDNEVYYYPVGASSWTLGYTYPVGTRINFLYYDELLVGTDFGMFGHMGTSGTTSVNELVEIPEDFRLYQNYPNPFNPVTTISFYLKENKNISLKIFDILGNEIATLAKGLTNSGSHTIKLNSNQYGLASGMYIYSLRYNGKEQTRKMILLK